MADVFISYKSERRLAAEYLAEIIGDYGFTVWWDYSLVLGEDFDAQIERELRQAKASVVLWCPLSVMSTWVRAEASLASELKTIVPVKIERTDLPLAFRLAQTLDLSTWDGSPKSSHLDRLVRDIAARVGRAPNPNWELLARTEAAWRRWGSKRLLDMPLSEAVEPREPIRFGSNTTVPEPSKRPAAAGSPDQHRASLIRMIEVPPGNYLCGLEPEQIAQIVGGFEQRGLNLDSDSLRKTLSSESLTALYVPGFKIGATPVTNREFSGFVADTGYRTTAERVGEEKTWRLHLDARPDHPVVYVNFYDARAFCSWSGLGLPTADQWRRAFRGNDRRLYPWGDIFDKEKCNTAESCSGYETTPVTRFAKGVSPFGCYDLVGNVEEWTATADGGQHIVLGGSWCMSCELYSLPVLHRVAEPDFYSSDTGFRCVAAL
jgi:formylglycine-generating enzyme required for sulfatase activity